MAPPSAVAATAAATSAALLGQAWAIQRAAASLPACCHASSALRTDGSSAQSGMLANEATAATPSGGAKPYCLKRRREL